MVLLAIGKPIKGKNISEGQRILVGNVVLEREMIDDSSRDSRDWGFREYHLYNNYKKSMS